jgi:hypothetical protein
MKPSNSNKYCFAYRVLVLALEAVAEVFLGGIGTIKTDNNDIEIWRA